MQKHLISLTALASALVSILPACGNVDDKIAATQSSICHINSDCATDLVCVFQRCHDACTTSRDCERGSRCVAGVGKQHVCQLADEARCDGEKPCSGAQICGVDGECRDGCNSDSACLDEQVCRSGTCADSTELDAQGQLTPATTPTDAPIPCAFDSDCPDALVCRARTCVTECTSEADCDSGQLCRDGRCTTPAVETQGCVRNSDCDTKQVCEAGACKAAPTPDAGPECSYDSECANAGEHCVSGACQCECRTSADCAGGQQCKDGCQCVAGRVIEGNVVVNDTRELAAILDVVQITGKLTIQIPGIGEYHLPNLQHVGAFSTYGDRAVIVLDVLEDAPQGFTCYQDCRAPHLKTAGTVQFSTSVMREVELPALTDCKDLKFFYGSQLRRVSAPLLTTASILQFEGNGVLTDIDLPMLSILDAISVAMNESLVDFSLPLANPKVAVSFAHMAKLETLSLPAMTAPTSDIMLDDQIRLKKVDFSGLTSGRSISLTKLPALDELKLTKLEVLTGQFVLKEAAGPAVLSLPLLTDAKDFTISKVSTLTSVEAPALDSVNNLFITYCPITSVDWPVTKVTGGLQFQETLALTSVKLSRLDSVTYFITLLNTPNLKQLDLSKLTTAGDVYFSNTGLSNLTSLTVPDGSLTTTGSIALMNNPALPVCAISTMIAAIASHKATNQAGNLECVCNGAVCQ